MSWIITMPDCPTNSDFESIAEDLDMFNDCKIEFERISELPPLIEVDGFVLHRQQLLI